MAAARHNPTRRTVLGAAVAVPVWLVAAPVAAGEKAQTRWARSLASYWRAEAALVAYSRDVAKPSERIFQAIRDRWPAAYDFAANLEAQVEMSTAWDASAPVEQHFNDLECARLAALRHLLRAPAPDLPALAVKIELAVDHEV